MFCVWSSRHTRCAILDQTEVQRKLAEEQLILDDHKDKVEDLMERLEDLVVTTEPVIHRAPGVDDH